MKKAKPISELYAEFTSEEIQEIEEEKQLFIAAFKESHEQNSHLDLEEIEEMVEEEIRKYRKSLLND